MSEEATFVHVNGRTIKKNVYSEEPPQYIPSLKVIQVTDVDIQKSTQFLIDLMEKKQSNN